MRPRWWSCSTPTGALPTQSPNPAPAVCSPARLRVESGGTSLAVAPPASCVCVWRRFTSPPPLSHHLSRDAHATLLETGVALDVVGMPLPEVPHTPPRVSRPRACAARVRVRPVALARGEIWGDLGRDAPLLRTCAPPTDALADVGGPPPSSRSLGLRGKERGIAAEDAASRGTTSEKQSPRP